jgi:hypothetical protein
MGSSQSSLGVLPTANSVKLCNKLMANIMDHKSMINIKPFGQCKSLANPTVAAATAAASGKLQEMPCIPATTVPWLNGNANVLVKEHPALMDNSKCMCMWVGTIEVTDSGQKEVQTTSAKTLA